MMWRHAPAMTSLYITGGSCHGTPELGDVTGDYGDNGGAATWSYAPAPDGNGMVLKCEASGPGTFYRYLPPSGSGLQNGFDLGVVHDLIFEVYTDDGGNDVRVNLKTSATNVYDGNNQANRWERFELVWTPTGGETWSRVELIAILGAGKSAYWRLVEVRPRSPILKLVEMSRTPVVAMRKCGVVQP
jgi:hypothetical protein